MPSRKRGGAAITRGLKLKRDDVFNARAVVTQTAAGWHTTLDAAQSSSDLVISGDTPKTPMQLRQRCTAQGGKVRYQGDVWEISHPGTGKSFKMLTRWKWTQDRQVSLKDARNAGFIVDPLAVVRPPIERPAPTLEEKEVATIGEILPSDVMQKAKEKTLASQRDLDVIWDVVRKLEIQVVELETASNLHAARIDHLRAENSQLKAGLLDSLRKASGAAPVDPNDEIRAEILELFKQVKPGWLMASGPILANLGVPDDRRRLYQEQIRELAKRGDLLSDREVTGRGGANANYRLNPDLHPDKDHEVASESA